MTDKEIQQLQDTIRQFLDYQIDVNSNNVDPEAYQQAIASFALEWSTDRLRSTLTEQEIHELLNDCYNK